MNDHPSRIFAAFVILGTLMVIAFAAMIIFLAATTPGNARDWYSGTLNEKGESCCGGTDCHAIPDDQVTPVKGGYEVRARDFGVYVKGVYTEIAIDAFVPNARAKPAKQGGEYHLCFWGGEVKCFFFPAPSF